MILKLLLMMELCGFGDHLAALPALSMLREHQVTVIARKYYSDLFRDVEFLQAAGQDRSKLFTDNFDRVIRLHEWSSIEEIKHGRYVPRMNLFANLVGATLPVNFSWIDYLAPRRIETGPYIILCGSAVGTWRSLEEKKEAALYSKLAENYTVVRLPRVNIYRNTIQPIVHNGEFVASDLRELINLVYNARAVVSVDSGPLHLACVLGVPAIGMFGPTGPEVFRDYERYVNVDLRSVQGEAAKCSLPCYYNNENGFYHNCEGQRHSSCCMEHFDIERVLNELKEVA